MTSRRGRPKVSSRETIAEAACELFLEQGFEATSITQITSRAGVSRSSFFNYFGSKSAIFWAGLDERIDGFDLTLAEHADTAAPSAVQTAALRIAVDFQPDALALAIVHADAMGIAVELGRESAVRRARISQSVAMRFRRDGVPALAAEVIGAAWGGAVLAAVEAWALGGAGSARLADVVAAATAIAAELRAPR